MPIPVTISETNKKEQIKNVTQQTKSRTFLKKKKNDGLKTEDSEL